MQRLSGRLWSLLKVIVKVIVYKNRTTRPLEKEAQRICQHRQPKRTMFGFGLQGKYSLRASSPVHGQTKRASRERASEGVARSRVLARLVLLAQIGELARRLEEL